MILTYTNDTNLMKSTKPLFQSNGSVSTTQQSFLARGRDRFAPSSGHTHLPAQFVPAFKSDFK